jgi:hypothetical protein
MPRLVIVLVLSRTPTGTVHLLVAGVLVGAPEAEEVFVPQLRDEKPQVGRGLCYQHTSPNATTSLPVTTHIHGEHALGPRNLLVPIHPAILVE